MKLSELLSPWLKINIDCDITGIEQDSRKIKKGDLFLAYPGLAFDGRMFIDDALNKGAAAVLYDPLNWPDISHSVCIPLPELIKHRGKIASLFFNHPSHAMDVIGVTGTNGKTTIAYLLAEAYERLGKSSIYIGTLGAGPVHSIEALGNTTPDPVVLQSILAEALDAGTQAVCMEVSSHALDQGRVNGIHFKGGIFTNLTHDHLDYHKTMAAYAEAKSLLFSSSDLSFAVINGDDAYADVMRAKVDSRCKLYVYGLSELSDVYATSIVLDRHGTTFKLHSPWGDYSVKTKLIGHFNVYNVLAVMTSLAALGFNMLDLVAIMKDLKASPGRMEIVRESPCVIVDYAHTPDALENTLKTLKQLKSGALYVVFGCGGDRDRTKRPMMGEIASRYADYIIITSDNPRSEDPQAIIDEIRAGIAHQANVVYELDRKNAIHKALSLANDNDIVLIAGKGHENYQQVGSHRYFFSDQAVVLGSVDI